MKSLILWLSALIGLAVTAPAQDGRAILIEAARLHVSADVVLDGEDARLAIRDGKVLAVGPEIPAELAQRARRIVYPGATIVPGFVNPHDHLELGDDLVETIDAFTPALRAADAFDPFDEALARFARGGVTTVGLAPVSKNTFAGVAAAVRFDGETGQVDERDSYLKAALIRDSLYQQRYPTSRMGAAELFRESFAKARDPLQAERPEYALLREVLDGQRRMAIHARSHAEILTALELCEELRIEPILLGAYEADQSLEALRRNGASLVIGKLDADSEARRLELPARLEQAGLPFSFAATDPEQLRCSAAFAIRHGMSTELALQALTLIPARQLGVDDRVGSLLVGRYADLAVFQGPPLDLSSPLIAVWSQGVAIVEPAKEVDQEFDR